MTATKYIIIQGNQFVRNMAHDEESGRLWHTLAEVEKFVRSIGWERAQSLLVYEVGAAHVVNVLNETTFGMQKIN